VTEANAQIGRDWLAAFNAKDLDRLLSLYAETCTHTSPKLRVQRPESGGKIRGKEALRAWWADAFARIPELRYEPLTITATEQRVFLEYMRHAPGQESYPVAEVFDVENGKIAASRVYHG
jgi:limonene-1,2-epoxide hydrolase